MSVLKEPKAFLPYGRQTINQDDIDAVVDVLKSDYLTTGPMVDAFEAALSKRFDGAWVVAVNSGTAALHLAYRALGIGPGDYVIVPAVTYLATANAALMCGAELIFADVDPDNGLMGPQQLQEILNAEKTKKIRAVAPVHLGGQTEQLSEIYRIAQEHQLFVVTDACHALGTKYIENGLHDPIGNCRYSDVTVFSFHPVKTIAMGEGGAIATKDADIYRKVKRWRSHGVERNSARFIYPERSGPWYYEMQDLGFNYRATDILCALGLSQLKKLDQFCARRRDIADRYDRLLAPLSPMIQAIRKTYFSRPCWHLYSILIDYEHLSFDRSTLMETLRERNIGTQVLYIPVNEQPFYRERYGVSSLHGAKRYYQRTLSLPMYASLRDEEIDYIVNTLKEIL